MKQRIRLSPRKWIVPIFDTTLLVDRTAREAEEIAWVDQFRPMVDLMVAAFLESGEWPCCSGGTGQIRPFSAGDPAHKRHFRDAATPASEPSGRTFDSDSLGGLWRYRGHSESHWSAFLLLQQPAGAAPRRQV